MKRPFLPSTPATDPYWSFLQQGELRVQRCRSCNQLVFYPREICPYCSGHEFSWEKLSGRGKIYSFTVVRRPFLPEFDAMAPYIYAIVELEEGIKLASNIINCPVDEVFIGMAVQATFQEQEEGRTLVLFTPQLNSSKK